MSFSTTQPPKGEVGINFVSNSKTATIPSCINRFIDDTSIIGEGDEKKANGLVGDPVSYVDSNMSRQTLSHVRDWSTEQVIEWVNAAVFQDKPKRAAQMSEAIKENELCGSELLSCKTLEDLMDALDISRKFAAKQLFEQLQLLKGREISRVIEDAVKTATQSPCSIRTQEDLALLIQMFRDVFPIKGDDDDEKAQPEDQCAEIKRFKNIVSDMAASTKNFVKYMMRLNLKKT